MANILQDTGYFNGPIQSFHVQDMLRLHAQGLSIEEIADSYGLDDGDVARLLSNARSSTTI